MAADTLEQQNVSLLSHSDLKERPGFKLALQEVGDRWYLYYAGFWHSGWGVLDVTDPANPDYLRWIDGPANTLTLQVQVADGLMLTSLERPRAGRGPIDGPDPDPDAPFEEGVYLWDVETDPERPERIGHYRTGGNGTHRNFFDGGEYAYLAADPGEPFDGRVLEVIDVSNPSGPAPVSKWWWPGQHAEDGVAAEETYYFHGPAYVRDDLAYLSYGRVGAVVLDVADPSEPRRVSRIDFGEFGSWLGVHSAVPLPDTDLLVVNDEAIHEGTPLEERGDPLNFTVLVDVSDPSEPRFDGQVKRGPRIIGWVPHPTPEPGLPYETYHDKPGRFGPHNQHHYRDDGTRFRSDDYLFMTWFNAGLRIFDVSDPIAPTEAGYFVPSEPEKRIGMPRPRSGLTGTFEDVVVDSRGYVYCTDPQQGLFVLETDLL